MNKNFKYEKLESEAICCVWKVYYKNIQIGIIEGWTSKYETKKMTGKENIEQLDYFRIWSSILSYNMDKGHEYLDTFEECVEMIEESFVKIIDLINK